MSQFFRKGGIALNDTEWIQDFADRRLQYGVSQTKLAVMAGISREHLSRIESGKVAVTEEMKAKLLEALEKFNPEAPLTMLFDYVRIRFPTLDIGHIIKDIFLFFSLGGTVGVIAMCILQAGRQSDRKMMELKGEKKA